MRWSIPVWRFTRTGVARRLYEELVNLGFRVSVLNCFQRDIFDLPTGLPGRPEVVTVETVTADDAPERWNFTAPGLEPDHLVVGALVDDDLVGVAFLSVGGPVDIAELDRTVAFDGGYLWGLSVEPEWRRRGIASALVRRALTRLTEEGASSVSAFVAPDNHPSRALFRSMGFGRFSARCT